jgi:sugar phosphate isomerase/epimerase
MFLSLCRVTAGSDLPWHEFVALAATAGYDAVDVDLEAVRREGASATTDLLGRFRLRPAVCGVPVEFRRDETVFRDGMKSLEAFAVLAAGIGCPRMATWVPPAFERAAAEMRSILKSRFTEMAAVLAVHGVRLGLEFISPLHLRQQGHPCVWQMAEMLDLCRECGPNVGLLLDCWHWHHDPGHSVAQLLEADRDRIVTVHLNDSPDLPPEEIRDNQRLLPGEGVIDLKSFLAALRQVGYQDAVSVEVFGRLTGLPHAEAARMALQAARSVMAGLS